MAFEKALPTSLGGVKGAAKSSARVGMFAVVVIAGLGLAAFALPFLQRIPVVGGVLRSGQGMIPGKSATMTVDQWGRVK